MYSPDGGGYPNLVWDQQPAIPKNLDPELSYDCWGNEILADGKRKAGPLYHDGGFQKLLNKANLRWLFY